jgi:nucleotide-binding universal stress UspA family protein
MILYSYTINEGEVNTMPSSKEFNKIILAVDGSDASKKAAQKAFVLSKETGIKILALHVVHIPASSITPTLTTPMADVMEAMKKHGESILDEIAKMGSDMGVHIEKRLVDGIPDDQIIKFADKNDLIILGSKGHSTLDRILIGSVSEKVLHHSNATVMIVR